MSDNKLPVAKHLNDAEYKMFLNTYVAHSRSIGLEARKQFSLSDITKVKRNIAERCFEVHYQNGEWLKYYTNGTWG